VNAVEFERVSKSYAIYEKPGDRLRELLSPGRRSFHRDFWALRDLSFAIQRGEVFCIVGENGSGKSTTLQLIAGIMQPSAGVVQVDGRVAALLELGAGFNPEFTGRDNVYLNASILGLSKREIDRRYKAIEDFAEIGDFIRQPVKTYSSGMVVRLAFAVAINVDPEVLLVDEALAVGDTYFRHRCMRKVHELRASGITIVFVSHAIGDVKAIGDHVLWLERGCVIAIGEPDAVLPLYLAAMTERERRYAVAPGVSAGNSSSSAPIAESIPNVDHRHGDGRAEILGIAILNEYFEPLHLMMPQSRIVVRISFRALQDLSRPAAGFMLRNHLGLDFTDTDTEREGHSLPPMRESDVSTVDFHLDIPEFYPGTFSFSPSVSDRSISGSPAVWRLDR
jgi:lipopolysaccharide transport system ATP-binding protein